MSEMAIVSSRKARLQKAAEEGRKDAQAALEIANAPDDFLSTIQIGITVIGIFAGAFGGATIAEELETFLKEGLAMPLPHLSGAIALGFVVTIITYLTLIFGELVPKRIALHSPETIASLVAIPMRRLSQITKPAVAILSGSTNFILNLIRMKEQAGPPVTEAEIHVLVEQAAEHGVFEEAEKEMVASVLRLDDRKVSSIMTPRADVIWVDAKANLAELMEEIEASQHTRVVVAEESLDHVIGIIDSRTVMRLHSRGMEINIQELILDPAFVPETATVLDLLAHFRDTKQHMALVMDEYGVPQGLVTREDIFGAIVGELPVLGEEPKWESIEREDGSWLLDGPFPLDEFKRLFEIETQLPGETDGGFHTLAGFVLFSLERIPAAGDFFTWQDLRFEVVDMDRNRIDKLLVQKLPTES